jgi:hypothetical protein
MFCFLGALVGTLVGVLPGLGPVGAVAFLLSLTFKMEPASAIIMLAGIYYGAMYGGSTTSILVNIPGETASVVTCLDGYRMARQGRAGAALGIAAFASFIAGTIGVIGLMCLAPLLGRVALSFGPPEYFALTLTGLTLVSYLSQGSMTKALIMAVLGLLAGTMGMDPISGEERFTFGSLTLRDGLGLVPVAIGLFGANSLELGFRGGLSDEIVHTRFGGDGGCCQGVVPRDHHCSDAHFSQLGKPFPDAPFNDILEMDHPEHFGSIRYHQRGASAARDSLDRLADFLWKHTAELIHKIAHGPCRAFANSANRLRKESKAFVGVPC